MSGELLGTRAISFVGSRGCPCQQKLSQARLQMSIFKLPLDQSDPMRVEAYDYDLPDELIAAHPTEERMRSRMLVVNRSNAQLIDKHFQDITSYLRPHDRLVFNNSKVIPGRLHLRKSTGGKVEFLVLDRHDSPNWEDSCSSGELVLSGMYRSSNRVKVGQQLWPVHLPSDDPASALEVVEVGPGSVTIKVRHEGSAQSFLERFGNLPLPPYIVKQRVQNGEDAYHEEDDTRYQTLFAKKPGAIAAPTAGLHFSEELLQRLKDHQVNISQVTLHVGPGTFKPMSRETENLTEHQMHSERYEISDTLKAELEETRAQGGRIIAVGTTSSRVLETEARKQNPFEPGDYSSEIFLYPGHGFEFCDGLITNFHLPNSTLLTLVASLTGYPLMRTIYEHAIKNSYRFYSYGDGMLILP